MKRIALLLAALALLGISGCKDVTVNENHGSDQEGVYLEILEKDLPEALRIMKNGGYELPSGNVGWASDLKKFMDKLGKDFTII